MVLKCIQHIESIFVKNYKYKAQQIDSEKNIVVLFID